MTSRTGTGVHRCLPSLYGNKGIHARAEWIEAWMAELADRLRNVRVCCVDWRRVVAPCVTWRVGGSMLTGVFLDPPYSGETGRDPALYAHDSTNIAHQVREWAIANGNNPLLRIALCGYEGERQMPESWECMSWKAVGGYASQGKSPARENAAKERIWFSPNCLRVGQGSLFELEPNEELDPAVNGSIAAELESITTPT